MKKSFKMLAPAIIAGCLGFACTEVREDLSSVDAPKATEEAAFGIVGFATQNGGTTGGAGGTTVTVTTYAALKSALESSSAQIVKFSGTIYNGTKGGAISVKSNKTLLGVGSAAFLNGIGLGINNSSNVIIQNVKISMTGITDKSDPAVYDPDGDEGRPQIIVNSGDCINIQGTSKNIWIDHCEMYSIDPAVQTNQDLYDGLVDAKNGSQYITISWCYFHDHHKTHLIGSSDSDSGDRKITFHHNYYKNISERLPLFRFGTAHVYNNYFIKIKGSAINSRMGACVRVESNLFETTNDPIISKNSTQIGNWHIASANTFTSCTGNQPTTSTCTASIPYSYTKDALTAVKTEVTTKAGVGKI